MTIGQPEEQSSRAFGRVEETVVENDPTIGYTKSRTVLLDHGYEYLSEKFEGDVFDKRSLTVVPEEGIKRVELTRIYKNVAIGLSEVDNEITLALYLHDPEVRVFGDIELGNPVLQARYDVEGDLDSLRVFTLPRSSTKRQRYFASPEEALGSVSDQRTNSAFMGEFTEEGFAYVLNNEDKKYYVKYNTDFNLLERGFRLERSLNLITVHQRLLTPATGIATAYLGTVPLSFPNEAIPKLHGEGKTWRNFLDEIGIKADST